MKNDMISIAEIIKNFNEDVSKFKERIFPSNLASEPFSLFGLGTHQLSLLQQPSCH
jgi:hypothetical protein